MSSNIDEKELLNNLSYTNTEIKNFLIKKIIMISIISGTIIGDLIPVIVIMAGLWVIRKLAIILNFEQSLPIKIINTFSEGFMVIIYLYSITWSFYDIHKKFKYLNRK